MGVHVAMRSQASNHAMPMQADAGCKNDAQACDAYAIVSSMCAYSAICQNAHDGCESDVQPCTMRKQIMDLHAAMLAQACARCQHACMLGATMQR